MSVESLFGLPADWRPPLSPAHLGRLGADPFWVGVQKLLMQDKVESAFELSQNLGLGGEGERLNLFNLIAAERETRKRGTRQDLSASLSFEYINEELGQRISPIIALSAQIAESETKRFDWDSNAKTLVTFLPKDFDAPWASARYGYCAPRDDLFKIGIPFHATLEPSAFTRVFSHEFAHVISQSVTKGKLSHWVSEGFSVFASNDCSDNARLAFLSHPGLWQKARRLGALFGAVSDLGSQDKWFAYQQAGWTVRYMIGLHDEATFQKFLKQHADESFLRNLKIMALNEAPTDEALSSVYGVHPDRLFTEALKALGSA